MKYPRPTIENLDGRLCIYIPPLLPRCPIHQTPGFYGGLDTTCRFLFRHYECGCVFAQQKNVQDRQKARFFLIATGVWWHGQKRNQ